MTGKYFLNSIDMFTAHKAVFGRGAFNELMKPFPSWPNDTKSLALPVMIVGNDLTDFWNNYNSFIAVLDSGEDVLLRVTDLKNKTYKLSYDNVSNFAIITKVSGDGKVKCTFILNMTDDYPDLVVSGNPTANAGIDKSVTLPTNSITLNGTASGSGISILWTKVSGGAATIVSPNNATTSVTGLEQGNYVFRMTVTDENGVIVYDEANITVAQEVLPASKMRVVLTLDGNAQQAQVINKFGANRLFSIQFDDNNKQASAAIIQAKNRFYKGIPYRFSVALIGLNTNFNDQEFGQNSTTLIYEDMPALIAENVDFENHSHKHISVANVSAAATELNNNQQLFLTKIGYLMASHVVPVNYAYYVQAAKNLNFLTATTQNQKDGLPIYPAAAWENGNMGIIPEGFAQLNRRFTDAWSADIAALKANIDTLVSQSTTENTLNIVLGTHTYNETYFTELLDYLEEKEFYVASVRELFEYKYIKENAGEYITQTVNGNKLTIDIDFANLPRQIRWRDLTFKLPNGLNIVSATSINTDDVEFTGGTCNIFKQKLSWTSIAMDALVAGGNIAPVANAGNDQTIKLPANSITLTGTASDADGTIVSSVWSKVSGGSATITSPNNLITTVTGLSQGAYVFRLTVTDDDGSVTTDDVTITVQAANTLPIVNAGADQTITLPISQVTLTGTASDSDGTIASRTWTKLSGGSATITSPNSNSTTVTGLVAGSYVFRFTVVDNEGGTSYDDVSINVSSGVAYEVERTFRLDLRNPQFQPAPSGWNGIGGNNAAVQNGNTYVSPTLVDSSGTASTLTVTIPAGFDGGASNSAGAYTGETGVVPDTVLNTAFLTTSTTTPSKLRINNLKADKYYQVYMLGVSASANVNARFGVTGYGTVDKISTNNVGTSEGAMLADPAWAVINNVQRDVNGGIDITFLKLGGNFYHYFNAIVIEESNTMK